MNAFEFSVTVNGLEASIRGWLGTTGITLKTRSLSLYLFLQIASVRLYSRRLLTLDVRMCTTAR